MAHNRGFFVLLVIFLGLSFFTTQAMAAEESVLKTQKDKISYSVGVSVAKNFQQQGVEVDSDIMIKGLKDVMAGGKLLLTDDEMRTTLNTYQEELRQKQAKVRDAAAEKNGKAGEAFLAANKKKKDVVTLPSGLQYKILKAGDGRKPTDKDTVECNYRGTLINGTEFDSSYSSGKPVSFKVTGVIPGWTEALKLMSVGSKWQLFVPHQLAYGERGAGNRIGPREVLIFEVELVAIK